MRKLLFVLQIAMFLLCSGCAGNRKAMYADEIITGAVFCPNGELCVVRKNTISFCAIDEHNKTDKCQTVVFRGNETYYLLAADSDNNRVFFCAADSVFAYSTITQKVTKLTKGGYAKSANCARLSADGKFLAFSSSPWNNGTLDFYRLTIVDAENGGIIYFCDSLANSECFRWIDKDKLGYLLLWNENSKPEVIGKVYNIKRQAVMPTRDGDTTHVLPVCTRTTSYNNTKTLEIINTKVVVKPNPEREN